MFAPPQICLEISSVPIEDYGRKGRAGDEMNAIDRFRRGFAARMLIFPPSEKSENFQSEPPSLKLLSLED